MGEHRRNPVAIANAVPQRRDVPVADLGEGIGLVGLSLEPIRTPEGGFAVGLMAQGGRLSDLVPMQPRKVLLAVIQCPPIETVRALLDGREPEERAITGDAA